MYHSLQTSIQVYHVLLLLVSSHDFEPIFIIFSSELKNTVRPAQIKTNHQNLWHVTSILVCCIFGLVDVAAALFVTSEVGTQRCLWSWSKVRVDAPKFWRGLLLKICSSAPAYLLWLTRLLTYEGVWSDGGYVRNYLWQATYGVTYKGYLWGLSNNLLLNTTW